MNFITPNGRKVDATISVRPDSYVTTLTVTIHSLAPISAESVKNQLQKKWKVTDIQETNQDMIVK